MTEMNAKEYSEAYANAEALDDNSRQDFANLKINPPTFESDYLRAEIDKHGDVEITSTRKCGTDAPFLSPTDGRAFSVWLEKKFPLEDMPDE